MNSRDRCNFDAFYETNQQRLLGFLIRMGLVFHDAEDAFNDCFVAVWLHWADICDGNPRAYLYRVARNEIHKHWRKGRRIPEDLVNIIPDVPVGDFAQQVVDGEEVREALLALPEREREAVLLRYYVECSISETAMIMGDIKPGTVKSYASKACDKLNLALGGGTRSKARKGGS